MRKAFLTKRGAKELLELLSKLSKTGDKVSKKAARATPTVIMKGRSVGASYVEKK